MTAFNTPSFLPGSIIYEVNLRQFTPAGTIAAFMEHIPRIKNMGADILWFMPIHPIGEQNRKGSLGSYYSIRDHREVNPEFGTRDDFRELVTRVHEAGMKLVIDWVANHTAWDHIWTKEHPDFYVRNDSGQFISPFDWTDTIQLDHANTAQQEAVIEAMEYWVREFDIDGFRADMAHLVPLEMWVRARQKTEAIKPSLIWLAETEDPAYHAAFDISYAWKWMHFTERFLRDQLPVSTLCDFLRQQWSSLPEGAFQMYFTSNHDENSWNGTEYDKYGMYAQALALACFTLPRSVPMIYGGQEIPLTCRLPFFDKAGMEWPSVLRAGSFYSSLCAYRRNGLAAGEFRFLDAPEGILAYRRSAGEADESVAMNLGRKEAFLSCEGIHGRYLDVLKQETLVCNGSFERLLMPGDCLLLVRQV